MTACPGSDPEKEASGPNVLIIITDDQRVGSLVVMPETRRYLVRGGTTFKNAFVTTPMCCPSRASVFSGRYAHNHGVVNNEEGQAEALDQSTLIQSYLHRAGYRTGLVGKYLNKWDISRAPPNFDEYEFYSEGAPYLRGHWNLNGDLTSPGMYSTDFLQQRAEEFLRSSESGDEQPWFLYLATPAPHGPSVTEPQYRGVPVPSWSGNPAVREKDRSDKPRFVRREREDPAFTSHVRDRQLRTLMSVDDLVGGILGLLRELDEERRTLVIFTSDNGVSWGEHFLRGKSTPYTNSIQVPLMMRWPGRIPEGKVDSRIVANIDIAPTILDATSISPDRRMDGRSVLKRSSRRQLLAEYTFMEGFEAPNWASLRTKAFQYTEYYKREGGGVRFREYYDLERDPWQLHNLLGDEHPSNDPNVEALTRRLDRARACEGTDCP
jgi:arylsulfatase A-like enzyme